MRWTMCPVDPGWVYNTDGKCQEGVRECVEPGCQQAKTSRQEAEEKVKRRCQAKSNLPEAITATLAKCRLLTNF